MMAAGVSWAASLDEAFARATAERRFVLVDFSKQD
jgi:hypothetical protein